MSERQWSADQVGYDEWMEWRRVYGIGGRPRCASVGCYRKVSRWSVWWNRRRHPVRVKWCGSCNRRFKRAWRDWTGASLRSRLSVRNEDQP